VPASLSAREAIWLALEAQDLHRPRPRSQPGLSEMSQLARRLGTIQIDAVNVLARTQFVVPFSRFGGYDSGLLLADAGPGGSLFEYWGHATSLLPVELQPALRWRMAERRDATGGGPKRQAVWKAWRAANGDYIDQVLAQARTEGPLRGAQLTDPRPRQGEWWERRSVGRQALEWLSGAGILAVWRTESFEAVYDLAERFLPPAVINQPTPSVPDAHRLLAEVSLRSLGVGTAADVAGYLGIGVARAKARLAELVESGQAEAVSVEGWKDPAYCPAGSRPRRPARRTATLISPFDSLIWDRKRTERLFAMSYVIEIYVPAPLRAHGYYVLPVLLGDRLVARLDLKTDRSASALRVLAAHVEPGVSPGEVASPIASELGTIGRWLRTGEVSVARRGNLASALGAAVRQLRS
jgi:uncharacterized protein